MLTVFAPAKVNLVLEILGETADLHQVSSIIQTINLCDVIEFRVVKDISFVCNEPSLQHDNIVEKAAYLLKETTHCTKGAEIKLYKNIPWGAGFGGGSSDAANTLLALNQLWSLNLPTNNLTLLASKLGSDVPFFLNGGTSLVEGAGEKVTPLLALSATWFVLLVPPLLKIPNKTRRLYSELHKKDYTEGKFVSAALLSLLHKRMIAPHLMFNVFENIAFGLFPRLTEYKQIFERNGASRVHLAGSGPSLFTTMANEEQAKELYSSLKNKRLESYVASSLPARISNYP